MNPEVVISEFEKKKNRVFFYKKNEILFSHKKTYLCGGHEGGRDVRGLPLIDIAPQQVQVRPPSHYRGVAHPLSLGVHSA